MVRSFPLRSEGNLRNEGAMVETNPENYFLYECRSEDKRA